MPVKLIVPLIALFASVSCLPDKPCGGQLVFDEASQLCYDCPQGAKFKNGTCECPAGSTYKNTLCAQTDDGSGSNGKADAGDGSDAGAAAGGNAKADAGAGASQSNGCKDYCGFATVCIGGNTLAASVLTDVVKGLHADNAAMCETSCKGDLGSMEATDPAVACFQAGKDGTMCNDPNPQTGLTNAFGLVGQCCAPNASSALCKSICTTLKASPATASNTPFCK